MPKRPDGIIYLLSVCCLAIYKLQELHADIGVLYFMVKITDHQWYKFTVPRQGDITVESTFNMDAFKATITDNRVSISPK